MLMALHIIVISFSLFAIGFSLKSIFEMHAFLKSRKKGQ